MSQTAKAIVSQRWSISGTKLHLDRRSFDLRLTEIVRHYPPGHVEYRFADGSMLWMDRIYRMAYFYPGGSVVE